MFETPPFQELRKELANPTPVRVWAIAKAFEQGMQVEELHALTRIDRWFLAKLHGLHMIKSTVRLGDRKAELDK